MTIVVLGAKGGAPIRKRTGSGRVDVHAAGGVVWRRRRSVLEILLIHRPRYDDWSFPKGKVEKGEDLRTCAIREIAEETRVNVALRRPAGVIRYRLGNGLRKEVTYWVATPLPDSHPALVARPRYKKASKHEIDEAAWLPVTEALAKLSSDQDREILERVLAWEADGTLDALPVIVVRHARAVKRSNWKKGKGTEDLRPLTGVGQKRAAVIARYLAAYGSRLLVSSPWKRCVDTLVPYEQAAGVRIVKHPELTEAAHKADKKPVMQTIRSLIDDGDAAAVACVHRPSLPTVLDVVAKRSTPDVRAKLPSVDPYLKTGELLILHVARRPGKRGRVVAFEQFRPVAS